MRPFSLHRGDPHPDLTGTVLCHDVPGAFRKGHVFRSDDIPRLIDAEWTELHLIELGPDDIGQREAGQRLAGVLCSNGLRIAAAGHRSTVKAAHNGLLKIDVAALQRMNSIPGIAIFTLRNDDVVAADQTVAEAQITPLAIDRSAIEEAARERGVLRNLPFAARDVVLWSGDDRVIENVTAKLRWYGCAVSVRAGAFRCTDDGALHIVAGSNPLDPLDPVLAELQRANVQRIGLPVHPGTLLWIATFGTSTIMALPSCGSGPQVTGFDLVLPKILAEGRITNEEIAALGHGGILNFSRARTLAREHEPVR